MTRARVYIDANILKFSATRLLRFRPREVMVDWGGTRQPLTVHDSVTLNPNDGIANNPELRREAELLPQVAAPAGSGIVDFLINIETQMEVWGLPNLDSETGSFYGAPHTLIEAPVQYGRIMFGGDDDYRKEQFNFLRSLRHERWVLANCNASLVPTKAKQRSTEISFLMRFIYGVQSTIGAIFS